MRSVSVLAVGGGPGHAVCARFERRASGPLLLRRFAVVPVEVATGEGSELARWSEALARAVPRVGPDAAMAVALPASVVSVRRVALPPLPPAQREKLLAFELQQAASQPPGEVVSAQVTVTQASDHTRVVLAVARRETVSQWEEAVRTAGLRVDRLEAGCAALYRAFRYNYPASRGSIWAVVDLGVRSLRVMLTDPATYAVRTVTLNGGAMATGTAPAFASAVISTQAMAERIHLELARLLAAQEASRPAGGRIVVHRLLLTGEDAGLPGLSEALAPRLSVPVERMDPLLRVEVDAGVDVSGQADRLGELVGLALPPSETMPCLDLSPAPVRQAREWRRRRPFLALAGLALLVAPLPPGCVLVSETRALQQRSEALAGVLQPIAVLQGVLATHGAEEAVWRAQGDDLVHLLHARSVWVEFLSELQARLGTVDGVWFDGFSIAPGDEADGARRLRITGRVLVDPASGRPMVERARTTVQTLLEGMRQWPLVESLESERFDTSQAEGLRFESIFKLAPRAVR